MTANGESEVRAAHVTLHRRGRKENGTLSLGRHHLTFTYLPAASQVSTASHDIHAATNGTAADADAASNTLKAKSKTIWIAYPMINSCILKPSHVPADTTQQYENNAKGFHDAEDLFPPTQGSNTYGRTSTDSPHLAPFSPSRRPASPSESLDTHPSFEIGRAPAIRLRCKDFQMLALHFNTAGPGESPDDLARRVFFTLRRRCCVERLEDLLAFHFQPPSEERSAGAPEYDARREFARMGIGGKAAEGPGSAWRITDINRNYTFSATYPSVLCVPRDVSDNMLKYGGTFRSKGRIPALAYLHFNGGSITRSAQPLVGVQNKRSPQDERLVSAIFSSHAPGKRVAVESTIEQPIFTSSSTTTLASIPSELEAEEPDIANQSDTALHDKDTDDATPKPLKVYGSQRRNLLVDARPRLNAFANRVNGGGIEDVTNYQASVEVPIEKVFLNIGNIHVMRASLEKVMDSFGNSDYVDLPPNQDTLRKSGWLNHIAAIINGAEMVARVVGLSGSHALIHCSDGWDRTSQVSALAQIMLNPFYRTLTGFITLVQKDFLSFGHKFKDRNGVSGCEKWFEIENERITPARARDHEGLDSNSLNALGAKAFTGAKIWLEKNRGNLFRQPNASRDEPTDSVSSRPASPPPNPILHSPATSSDKEDKRHKDMEKEIAPIFHQFLDAVYQLQRQKPEEFEFNERFLLRLLYQTYAGQYGEFLFNCEKERLEFEDKTPSVWGYFLARRSEFINGDYAPQPTDSLLLPKREGGPYGPAAVRWWSKLYGRKEEEMNVPRALALADPPSLNLQFSSASLEDGTTTVGKEEAASQSNGTLRPTRSSPSLVGNPRDSISSAFSMLSISVASRATARSDGLSSTQSMTHQETDEGVVLKYAADSTATRRAEEQSESRAAIETEVNDQDGDPLGVMKSTTAKKTESWGPDFAAFASHSAFSDK